MIDGDHASARKRQWPKKLLAEEGGISVARQIEVELGHGGVHTVNHDQLGLEFVE